MERLTDLQSMGRAFARYILDIRQGWAAASPEVRAKLVRDRMEDLFRETPATDPWIQRLLTERPAHLELYRDPEAGFVQMAHYHSPMHASPPHDHGEHWVVYGVYSGDIEICTYRWLPDVKALRTLDRHHLTSGQARIYAAGDIHATRQCAAQGSVVLRFLSTDLKRVPRSHYRWEDVTEEVES
ncbi:MAG: hypothetical protein K6T26_06390 [Alicyclobacillus sp.]|nr:hypothetical protein [Alicyclobacillus sp.]